LLRLRVTGMMRSTLFVILLVLLGAVPASAQSPTPVGVWLHPNQRIQVEIAPCGELLCGRLIWFKWPNDAQGLPLVDVNNPDPALRARPLLGLTILDGLRRTGEDTWAEAGSTTPTTARNIMSRWRFRTTAAYGCAPTYCCRSSDTP